MIRCVMIDLDGTLLRKPGKKTAGISFTALAGGRRISGNRNFTLCRLYSKIQYANLGGSRRLERSGDRARRPPLAASAAKPERKAIVENFRR